MVEKRPAVSFIYPYMSAYACGAWVESVCMCVFLRMCVCVCERACLVLSQCYCIISGVRGDKKGGLNESVL